MTLRVNLLAAGVFILTGLVALAIKFLGKNVRRPNGKKKGLVSIHMTLACCIVTLIALISGDYVLTGMAVILVYFLVRSKLSSLQNYWYQIIFSAIIGVGIPLGIFYTCRNFIKEPDSLLPESEEIDPEYEI